MAIDVFETPRTKEINGEADLETLAVGDIVTVYQGHNYGKLFSEGRKMVYVSTEGRTIIFNNQNNEVRVSKDLASYRDGVLVHPNQNRGNKY